MDKFERLIPRNRGPAFTYILSLSALVVAIILRWLLDPMLDGVEPTITVYGAVAFAVWLGGWRPALLNAIAGLLICEYLFIEPRGSFAPGTRQGIAVTAGFAFSSSLIILLGEAMRRAHLRISRAADASRRSEAQLQAVLDALPVGVIISDQTGRVVKDNAVTRELWGVPLGTDSWQGYADWAGCWPDTGEPIQPHEWAMTRALLYGEITRDQLVLNRRPGSDEQRYYSNNVAPVRDDAGGLIGGVAVMFDVTDKLAAERSLRESESQLRRVLDSLFAFVGVLTPDGAVVEVNRGPLGGDGTRVKDVIGKPFWECYWWSFSAESQTRLRDSIGRAAAGEVLRYDTIARTDDDQRLWIDFQIAPLYDSEGRITHLVPSAIDLTPRKQAEAALRESERRFRAVFNQQFLFMALLSPEGTVLEVNELPLRSTGIRREEVLGRHFWETPWWADLPEVRQDWPRRLREASRAQSAVLGEVRFQTVDGAMRIADTAITAVKDREGRVQFFIVQMSDITERRQALLALQRSEQKYRSLFETIDEGFCIIEVLFDESDRPGDYRFLETNPAFERLTGLVDARGRTMRSLAPAHEEQWFEAYGQVALSGKPVRFERHSSHFGRWYDVYAWRFGDSGNRQVAVLFTDVTARKQAEERLRESEARFREMADGLPLLVWLQKADGRLEFANRRFHEYFDEVGDGNGNIRRPLPLHPDDAEGFATAFESAVRERRSFHADCRVKRGDGSWRWIDVYGRPRISNEGNYEGFVVAALDVTDRRELEQLRDALLDSERSARSAVERLSQAKDDFLAMITHELRSPLASMLGWSQLLQAGKLSEEDTGKAVGAIVRGGSQLKQLIDDLLDVNSAASGKLKLDWGSVELVTLAHEAAADFGPESQRAGIQLVQELPENEIVLLGDAARLRQVIDNLLSNAIKFTPAGGQVRLRVVPGDEAVNIAVEDTGIGIEPDALPTIFDRFQQAESSIARKYKGLGLGLSLVKEITELHGGAVRAKSGGHGEGATFIVQLPHKQKSQASIDISGQCNGIRALVVDDETETLTLTARLLSDAGAAVTPCASAEQGLRELTDNNFDVLLCDLSMPDVDGYEFLRRVRNMPDPDKSSIPAVAVTAFAREEDERRSLARGFQAHYTKPIDAYALCTTIRELVHQEA